MSATATAIPTSGSVKFFATSRHGFVAPEGYVLASLDYAAQELLTAAVLSQDQVMLRSFAEPEMLQLLDASGQPVIVDGKEVWYKNPDADLHTLTAAQCCFPQIFEGKARHEWVSIAKDESLIPQKGSARDFGKRANFAIVYLATAQALTDLCYVPVEQTEQWIKRHSQTYVGFHQWAKEAAGLATARGWIANDQGRIRWVAEDNAKQAGASPARSGVNHLVQSMGAEMTKLSLKKIFQRFKGTKCRICMLVHDELVIVVPGGLTRSKKFVYENGILKPVYEPDEEASHWANIAKSLMEEAETEVFRGRHQGRADASLSRYWAH